VKEKKLKNLDEPIITIHHSGDVKPETLRALGECMTLLWRQVMSEESEFEKFKKAVKVIVNTPKEKKRKPKKKPTKKPKKKGGN
jgi:hypothetical protein